MIRHIESLGLPAAGKTTLMKEVARVLAGKELRMIGSMAYAPSQAYEKREKFRSDITSVGGVLMRRPRRSLHIWRRCAAFEQPTRQLQLRMYLNFLRVEGLVHRYRAQRSADEIIALDQGSYQAVWSLALRARPEPRDAVAGKARALLGLSTQPDLVILVDTPSDVVRHRLTRKDSRHGRLPALLGRDPGWLERAEGIVQDLWEIALSQPGVRTFRFRPSIDRIDDLVEAIAAERQPCMAE